MKHLSPAEIETIRVPEPKHDPFTLESLVAWLKMMPADEVYCYTDNGRCLLSQYFSEMFGRPVSVNWRDWRFEESRQRQPLPKRFDDIAVGEGLSDGWTFGAALTRARAALASQKGNAPCP
jgi:hypothetical protein